MKKIGTLLNKDPNNLSVVIAELNPLFLSIIDELEFFIKIDGTSCYIKNGVLYVRHDVKLHQQKRGKLRVFTQEEALAKLPEGAIACQEPDAKSGHWPHWVLASVNPKQYAPQIEAFNKQPIWVDGTYECVGPKINGNPHSEAEHLLIPHKGDKLKTDIRLEKEMNGQEIYNFFFNLFSNDFPWEGLVAYHNGEPVAKIRVNDFKLSAKYNEASSFI